MLTKQLFYGKARYKNVSRPNVCDFAKNKLIISWMVKCNKITLYIALWWCWCACSFFRISVRS